MNAFSAAFSEESKLGYFDIPLHVPEGETAMSAANHTESETTTPNTWVVLSVCLMLSISFAGSNMAQGIPVFSRLVVYVRTCSPVFIIIEIRLETSSRALQISVTKFTVQSPPFKTTFFFAIPL